MQPGRIQLPTDKKKPTDMTSFRGKHTDNKNTPNRLNYAQAISGNRFGPLYDDDEDKNEEMEDTLSSASSDTTPK
jgi:hypothetical protein